MLTEDYERALEAQQKPITWKKIGVNHFINPDTGVEIKYAWDRLILDDDKDWQYAWYVYEPRPSFERWYLVKPVAARQYSFNDARKYYADEAVQSIRLAREDRSFAADWQWWNEKLDAEYYDDRHPVEQGQS